MSETGIIKRVWSDEVRRQAYQIYQGPAKRNQSETARLLSTSVGETVPLGTVKGWADRDNWGDQEIVDSVAVIQESMDSYVSRLWVAAIPALRTIASISSGELSAESTAQHVDLDRRLRAAQFIVDRAQQLLLKQADSSRRQGTGNRAAATVDLKAMTPEQLRTYEEQLNRDR
jgi:hypothetical protein